MIHRASMIAAAALLSAAAGSSALAASTSNTVTITIQAPLEIVFTPSSPTIACAAAAGTVVSAVSTTGGDGNAVTLTMSGDTTDFALSGSNVVVASSGITGSDCGKTESVTVTATQP